MVFDFFRRPKGTMRPTPKIGEKPVIKNNNNILKENEMNEENKTLTGMELMKEYREIEYGLGYLMEQLNNHEEKVETLKKEYRFFEEKMINLKASAPELFALLEKKYEVKADAE